MKFKLRPWKSTDRESLTFHANNWNVSKNMSDLFPFPYTLEDADKFIKLVTKDNPTRFLAIDVDGKAVGGISIHPQTDIQRKNAELGYWLSEQFWGNGIISEAIPQMADYAFKSFDINRIFARPFGTNLASQRVLEKCGFILEARFEKTFIKNKELIDELVYALRR